MTDQERQEVVNVIWETLKKIGVLRIVPKITETTEQDRQNTRELPYCSLKDIGQLVQTVPKTKKEPAPQEAETSSSKNNSINNDNTKKQICQEETVDYKDKYYKCADLLLEIDVNIKKAHELLYNLWNDFAIWDIKRSQFIGAACLKDMSTTDSDERRAAQRLLTEYDRLFEFINISLDYTYKIKQSLEESDEI